MTTPIKTRAGFARGFGNTGTPIGLRVLFPAVALFAAGCAATPPPDVNDACAILEDRSAWYHAAIKAQKRWNMPVALTLAFIHQESSFKANAKPKRKKLFGFIPWKRPTSAYGYAQAIDGTWKQYKKETGRWFVFRNSFADSVDFMGWYNSKSVKTLGISPNDAYNLYLAYHEGWNGYRKKNHLKKSWLPPVAEKVQKRMRTYEKQLASCAGRLKSPWYRLWTAAPENATGDGTKRASRASRV